MSQDIASLFIRVDSQGVVTASKNLDDLAGKVQKTEGAVRKTETATQSAMASFTKLAGAISVAGIAYMAFTRIMAEINRLFHEGFKAVEDYYTSIASLAAMVLTFTKAHSNMGLAERWQEALKYSTEMIPILENIAAKTLLSGQETTALANAFARSGVFLDATNKKQIESFTILSNALPLMTQGQSIMLQINQEVRGLMGGGNVANSMLLQTLKAVNPEIEDQLKIWRAEGTVLEHLGELLAGFGPATAILENQWQAVKSTIDTTVMQTLRGGMEPVYKDIIGLIKNMDVGLTEHKGTISAGIVVEWNYVKNILSIVWNIIAGLRPLLEPLVSLTGTIAYGWGGILAVLEPISKIIGNILSMGIEVVKVFGNAVLALGALINLQPEVAKVAANEAIKSAKQVKALAIESADLFVNGIGDSLVKYDNQVQKAMTSGKKLAEANKYVFDPIIHDTEKMSKVDKEAANLKKQMTKQAVEDTRKATYEIDSIGMSQYQKDLDRITAEADKFKKAGVDKVTITKYTETEMALAKRKSFEVDAENARKMYEELQKGKEEYETLLDALQSATLNAHDKALHEISKAEDEVYKKIEKLLDEAKISWEQADVLFKLVPKKRQQEIPERLTAERDMYQDLRGYEDSYYAASTALIEKQAERYRDLKINEVAIEAWATEEKRKAQLLLYRTVSGKGTFSGGMSQGAEDYTKSLGNYFTQGEEIAKSSATAMHNSFQNIFFDGIKGQLKSFSDYWTSFTDSLLQTFTNMLADMVAKWIMNQAMMSAVGLFTGMVDVAGSSGTPSGMNSLGSYSMGGSTSGYASYFHSGGIVGESYSPRRMIPAYAFAGAPRLHKGLDADEFPAILQRGERVLSRKEVAQGGGNISFNIPMTINALGKIKAAQISDLRNIVEETVEKKIRSWS